MLKSVKKFLPKKSNKGAGMAEYGLVVGLIAVGSVGGVYATGIEVERIFCEAAAAIKFEEGCLTLEDQSPEPLAFGAYLPNSPVTTTQFTSSPSSRSMNFSYEGAEPDEFSDCTIQVLYEEEWYDVQSVDCQSYSGAFQMPSGIIPGVWDEVTLRLAGNGGSVGLAELGTLSCAPRSLSFSPTPTIDEDCDGNWDNMVPQLTTYNPARYAGNWFNSGANNYCRYFGQSYVSSTRGNTFSRVYTSLTIYNGLSGLSRNCLGCTLPMTQSVTCSRDLYG